MRTITAIFTVFFLSLAVFSNAQPPKLPVDTGSTYGAAVDQKGAFSVSELPGYFSSSDTVDVKVIAKVTDVCPKKGCWMSLQMPDNSKVFVKMKDYTFFVPLELIGKTVVVDARAMRIKTSVAELKHYAEDAKKSQAEIDAITQPKEEIRLLANGIVVAD